LWKDCYTVKLNPKRISLTFCFIILFFGVQTKLLAQFNACKDTLNNTIVTCSYQQDTMWDPVCGCDQHTYANFCLFNQAHLLNYTPRTCEEVTIQHLYPNPCAGEINYRIYLKQQEDAYVFIYDEYGRVHYTRFFETIADDTETLDLTSTLRNGFYIMVAYANGHYASKKFLKY